MTRLPSDSEVSGEEFLCYQHFFFFYYQMTALLSELSLNHIPKKAPQAYEESTKLQYIDDTAQCVAGEYDPLTL